MSLGRALKSCRLQRGLTQEDVCERSGLSVAYISLLERNKRDPTYSVVWRLADALGLPAYLLVFMGSSERVDSGLIDKEIAEKLSLEVLQLLMRNDDEGHSSV